MFDEGDRGGFVSVAWRTALLMQQVECQEMLNIFEKYNRIEILRVSYKIEVFGK